MSRYGSIDLERCPVAMTRVELFRLVVDVCGLIALCVGMRTIRRLRPVSNQSGRGGLIVSRSESPTSLSK
jgi:hypothetical protein